MIPIYFVDLVFIENLLFIWIFVFVSVIQRKLYSREKKGKDKERTKSKYFMKNLNHLQGKRSFRCRRREGANCTDTIDGKERS